MSVVEVKVRLEEVFADRVEVTRVVVLNGVCVYNVVEVAETLAGTVVRADDGALVAVGGVDVVVVFNH